MNTSRRVFAGSVAASALMWVAYGAQAQDEKRKPSLTNPTPEDASELAAYAVKLAREVEGVTLDYSPESLKHIDHTVLSFKEAGRKANDVPGTLVIFGCYVGEVLVRNLGSKWDMPNEKEKKLGFEGVGVRSKSGAFWNPIGKVFKLLANGEEDSVHYFYVVAKSREP